MKIAAFLTVIFCVAFIESCARQTSATQPDVSTDTKSVPSQKQPVLVELFTSEGCSSCPPADRALALLEKQQPVDSVDVITLEFHVDYWDGPGWKDPFSSRLFTQRQEEYASAFKLDSDYTPQMVVDGHSEFVGSEFGKATATITKSAATIKGTVKATTDGEKIGVSITNLPQHEHATVFLAVVEDALTSNVSGGENAGEKLAHTSVVRDLRAIGTVDKNMDKFEATTPVAANPGWNQRNLRCVIFVQENVDRRILAVARTGR